MASSDDLVKFSDDETGRLFQLYSDAETEILNEINRGLLKGNDTRYLQTMLQNVRAILDDLLIGTRTWCEEAIPDIYINGAEAADEQMRALGEKVQGGFGGIHQQAVKILADSVYDRFDDVGSYIGRRVNDIYRTLALENIKGSVVGYKSWQQVAKNLREQLAEQGITAFEDIKKRKWNMRSYAQMVARTTTMEAHLQGTAMRLQEHGHDLVKVSTHSNPCHLCAPWQGKILSLSGNDKDHPSLDEAKAAGLFHPNCLPAGVLVSGPTPLAAFTRWYDGELVILHTASGIELPVTPNHPILTPKGWVAAGQLIKGDYVIRQLGKEGMMQSVDPYKEQIPSRIEDVARSFGESKSVSTFSVPVSPEDFHGDGKGSDVCIIRTDGLLRDNVNSCFTKPTGQKRFSRATKFAYGLKTLSMTNFLLKRMLLSADSIMSGLSQYLSFIKGHTSKTCTHCGRSIRGGINTKSFKTALNRCLINTKALSYSLFGLSADIATVDVSIVQGYPTIDARLLQIADNYPVINEDGFNGLLADLQSGSELIKRLAGCVATDEIINIENRSFSGHVYNLQTTDGWYACNNIITHNCKHAYGLSIDLEEELSENNNKRDVTKNITLDDFEDAAYGKNIDPNILKEIHSVISKREKDRGFYINDIEIKSIPSQIGRVLMQVEPYASGKGSIIKLLINQDVVSGISADDLDKLIKNTSINLAQNLNEAVIHETGHAKLIHNRSIKEIEDIYNILKTKGIQGISKIAEADGVECIAEVEILLSRGQEVPTEAMDLYRQYVLGNGEHK